MNNRMSYAIKGLVEIFSFIVNLFLGLRLLLRLFDANRNAAFAKFIYDSSNPLLEPFRGIFPIHVLSPGYVFEFSTLFAMLVYTFISYLIFELLNWIDGIMIKS